MSITTKGFKEAQARIALIRESAPQAISAAVRREAETEMTEAKKRTPVLTGALRASGKVWPVVQTGPEFAVAMTFGDAASSYALYVHENTEAFHHVGQAKFLESVLLESARYMTQRIAASAVKWLERGRAR